MHKLSITSIAPKHSMRHLKLFFIALIGLALTFGIIVATAFSSHTQAHTQLDTSSTIYHFFTAPTAISMHADGRLFIANTPPDTPHSRIYTYGQAPGGQQAAVTFAFNTGGIVHDMLVHGGRMILLEEDANLHNLIRLSVYSLNGTPYSIDMGTAPTHGFSAIAVLDNWLYASVGNTLFVFDVNTLTFQRSRTVTEGGTAPIQALAAGNNALFVARIEPEGLTARRFATVGATLEAHTSFQRFGHMGGLHSFLHLSTSNELLAVTAGGISTVLDHLHGFPTSLLAGDVMRNGTIDMDAGILGGAGRIFRLNDLNTISSFAIVTPEQGPRIFGYERLHIASHSNIIPGFFNTPHDTTSSDGRIFVSDTFNNRISIQYGVGQYRYITGFNRPTAITARYGRLFVADSENAITAYDIGNGEEHPFTVGANNIPMRFNFLPEGRLNVPIASMHLASNGDLFVIDELDFRLWKLPASDLQNVLALGGMAALSQRFITVEGVGALPVAAVSSSPHAPSVYTAIRFMRSGVIVYDIVNLDNIAAPILTDLIGVRDIAVDNDGGIYVLSYKYSDVHNMYRYRITRFSRTLEGETTAFVVYEIPASSDQLFTPRRIHLANVDFRTAPSQNVLSFRDILITDAARHRVWRISANHFGVDNALVTSVLQSANHIAAFSNQLDEMYTHNQIIHTIIAPQTPLFMHAGNIFAFRRVPRGETTPTQVTLPLGFSVLVPFGINPQSDFTFIIADNLDYLGGSAAEPTVLSGYVRNLYLSAQPLVHRDPDDSIVMMASQNTHVYRFPAHQFPITRNVAERTPFRLLPFVYRLNEFDEILHGYFDNRNQETYPYLNTFTQWLRVAYVDVGGNHFEAYIPARYVVPYEIELPLDDIFVANTVIIHAHFDDSYAYGARAFALDENRNLLRDAYGNPVPHPIVDYIPFGRRVMVMGTFNSASRYHLVRHQTPIGVLEMYVRTPNIDYDGVDILQLLVILLAMLTIILTALSIGRYHSVKKTYSPKIPIESFI